jgi:hypothetical protein
MYYSRYVTKKNGVMLRFSLLQLVTSKPKVVDIPEAQPTKSLPCSCGVRAHPWCWHWFSCTHLLFFWLIVCMASLAVHWSSSMLWSFHHRKMLPSWPCEQGIISTSVAYLPKDKLPVDQEISSLQLSWSSYSRSSYPASVLTPWILLTPKSQDNISVRGRVVTSPKFKHSICTLIIVVTVESSQILKILFEFKWRLNSDWYLNFNSHTFAI